MWDVQTDLAPAKILDSQAWLPVSVTTVSTCLAQHAQTVPLAPFAPEAHAPSAQRTTLARERAPQLLGRGYVRLRLRLRISTSSGWSAVCSDMRRRTLPMTRKGVASVLTTSTLLTLIQPCAKSVRQAYSAAVMKSLSRQ